MTKERLEEIKKSTPRSHALYELAEYTTDVIAQYDRLAAAHEALQAYAVALEHERANLKQCMEDTKAYHRQILDKLTREMAHAVAQFQ